MIQHKVIVLCNNTIAFPAIQQVFVMGALLAIGVPETNKTIESDLCQMFGNYNIPILTLEKQKLTEQLIKINTTYKNDCFLLMTFPWKIPSDAVNAFKNRLFNFHYGILPQVRGVDPVFETIRNQHQEAGISLHEVTAKLDAGPILMIQKTPLTTTTTHGMLCTQLGQLAVAMVKWFISQNIAAIPVMLQEESKAVYYNRPGQKEVLIDWKNSSSTSIIALVKACNPWNKGAYTSCKGWLFRITDCTSTTSEINTNAIAGTIVAANQETGVLVACGDNNLLKITIFYTEEGFFEGTQLMDFGLKVGDCLSSI